MGLLIFLGAQIAIGASVGSIAGWELSRYLFGRKSNEN